MRIERASSEHCAYTSARRTGIRLSWYDTHLGVLGLEGVVYPSMGVFVSYGKNPGRHVCDGLEVCHGVQSLLVCEGARL